MGELKKIPNKTLNTSHLYSAVSHIGNYALFAGGYDAKHYKDNTTAVTGLDKSLTEISAPDLSLGRDYLRSACTDKYAMFFGGGTSNGSSYAVGNKDVYNESLIKQTTGPSGKRMFFAAISFNNYAVFAGGYGSDRLDSVIAYNESLTSISVPTLTTARGDLAAAYNENYMFFGGGKYSSSGHGISTVDIYDKSFTKQSGNDLSTSRSCYMGGNVGEYAMFIGSGTKVDAFNSSLTRTSLTDNTTSFAENMYSVINLYNKIYILAPNGNPKLIIYDNSLTYQIIDMFNDLPSNNSIYANEATTLDNYGIFPLHNGVAAILSVFPYTIMRITKILAPIYDS